MQKRELETSLDGAQDGPRVKRLKETAAASVNGAVNGNGRGAPPRPVDDEVKEGEADSSMDVDEEEDKMEQTGPAMSAEEVTEHGLKVWHLVRNAVDKEIGRVLSLEFLRLPSKRQYPDYYHQIKHPIALENIKTKLDENVYASLVEVKEDFDTCFRNAKKFNMRESQIWKDAKSLQKLASKEVSSILNPKDDNGEADGSEDESGKPKKSKSKGPNLTRLLKSRLSKLVAKTDANGRVLSNEFMDLPLRKKWPVYYKTIKKPICIEDIFKRIKRKEYENAVAFMADVDLVFSNAISFNEDHTPIWEDALTLKNYFHEIMQNIPAPFNGDAFVNSNPSTSTGTNKITIKVPQPHTAATSSIPTVTLRVPVGAGPSQTVANPSTQGTSSAQNGQTVAIVKHTTSQSPPIPPASVPPRTTASAASNTKLSATPTTPATPVAVSVPKPTAQPARPIQNSVPSASTTASAIATALQFAATNYHSPQSYLSSQIPAIPSTSAAAATPSRSTPVSKPVAAKVAPPTVLQPPPPSPKPVQVDPKPLKSILVKTVPTNRLLLLDRSEGVRTWSMRLARGETGLHISDIKFLVTQEKGTGEVGEEGDTGGADKEKEKEKEKGKEPGGNHEEEEEEDDDGPAATALAADNTEPAPTPSRRKRGRGRPKGSRKGKDKDKENKENIKVQSQGGKDANQSSSLSAKPTIICSASSTDLVLVKLDEKIIAPVNAKQEDWSVALPVGNHVLEIGRQGGLVWKIYIERLSS